MVVTALSLSLAISLIGREPECVSRAKALVKKVEELPTHQRGRAVDLAIRRDPRILCDVVKQAFFSSAPEAPPGCDASAPAKCSFPEGMAVAKKLAEDVDPLLYLRVELIAERLRKKKLFSEAHERLLSTLLLGSALQKEEDRAHAH